MRAAMAVAVVLGAGSAATADTPASVNLLTAMPTIVAVSSTVDNKTILPEHMVDGKLDTAWNSQTNELNGAWVAVRIAAGAHVDRIRLTAGFTKVDKKLGDLFTMNPRIKRVRVTRDGKPVTDQTLDPEARTLQDIKVDGPGGDYKIEVVDFLPGSKTTWREIGISELEIWGTPPKDIPAGAKKPLIRIGSLDARPPSQDECVKLLFPARKAGRIDGDAESDKVAKVEALELGDDLAICRVDHIPTTSAEAEGASVLAAVKRVPKLAVIQKLPDRTVFSHDRDGMGLDEATVTLSTFWLSNTEIALLVDETTHQAGPMYDAGKTTTRLYRVSTSAITPVLELESSWSGGESGDSEMCKLQQPDVGAALATSLAVECVTSHSGYPGNKADKDWSKTRTVRYRWKGGAYVKK